MSSAYLKKLSTSISNPASKSGTYLADTLEALQNGTVQGTKYYVNATSGDNTRDGLSWDTALLTMAAAFDKLVSGDVIYFHGKVREQLTTPAQVFDVTVVGTGNRPRHIDGTPKAGSQSAAMWTTPASPAAATPLVKVIQQGWRFVNILFAGPTDAACVQLFRNGDAGDDERDGSHAELIGCRLASGQDGIENKGGCGHVGLYENFVTSMTGFAIKENPGGFAYPIRWELIGNRFLSNTNMLKMACINWNVRNNSFVSTTTEVFDTDNGDAAAGGNIVVDNYFNVAAADFDPTGNVEGNTTDVWSNVLKDAIETGIPTD